MKTIPSCEGTEISQEAKAILTTIENRLRDKGIITLVWTKHPHLHHYYTVAFRANEKGSLGMLSASLFDEKYGDPISVRYFPGYSQELVQIREMWETLS
jgi:hypothetical protein